MFDVYAPDQIAVIFIVYLGAATAKGVTGLGFSTTCLPFLTISVGLKEALPLLLVPSIASNILVQIGAGRILPTIERFWPMLLATLPGIALGLYMLDRIDGVRAGVFLGAVLIGYCAFTWARPDLRLPARLEKPLAIPSGFLTGVVNGLTGSQVMPSMPFLMSLNLDRNVFIQAINCSFTLSSIFMAIGLSQLGLLTADAVILSVFGTVFVLLGIRLGERIRRRLAPEQFRLAVLGMLALLGLSLVLRGL